MKRHMKGPHNANETDMASIMNVSSLRAFTSSRQSTLSSSGLTGRPSIPETAMIETRGCGVLDSPAFAGNDSGAWSQQLAQRPPYPFFLTSLTLVNSMPSARSLV